VTLLRKYPNIEKVTRDGSMMYAAAISEALPEAIQISDRFHLFQGLTEALRADLSLLLPSYISVNTSESGNETNSGLPLTKKELNELERHYKKQEMVDALRKRYKECGKINIIEKEFNLTYRTVKKYLNNDPVLVKYEKVSSLTPYFGAIYESVRDNENSYQTFRRIKEMGYPGTYSNMARYIRLKKKKGMFKKETIPRKYLVKLLYNNGIFDLQANTDLKESLLCYLKDNKYVQSIIMLATEFRISMFSKNTASFYAWIEKARKYQDLKKLQSFINGSRKDIRAIENAIRNAESNGVVEGAVCKIKMIKRGLYGRCKFDLLKQKNLLQNQPD
jgi:transposase